MNISNRYSGKSVVKSIPKDSTKEPENVPIDVLTNLNTVYQQSRYLKENNNGIIFQR